MKRSPVILLTCLLIALSISTSAQRRTDIDSLFINGQCIGYTTTNWYCIEGDECPQFRVKSTDGKTISNRTFKGKTTVISFWIYACRPCRTETSRVGPELIDLYSPDEFQFISIGSGETLESARKFSEQTNATFPLCYDESGNVVKKFADNGFPKLFVVDSEGIVRMTESGFDDKKFNHLKEVVEELVKSTSR